MNNIQKDEEVIREYLDTNSGDCFETLYNRYVNKVYSRCLSLTKNSEQAQDFTHDIFIKMFSRLDGFQERSAFSTWLYSISYNYCMDQLRVNKRKATESLEEDMDYDHFGSEEGEELENRLHYLSQVIKVLTPQEVTLLRLKYQDGLEVKQIAKQLNLNNSAVKMRLKRSRDKVRQLYKDVSFQD